MDLKKELDRLDRERKEAEEQAKLDLILQQTTHVNELQQQKEELKRMMEGIKREKEEMAIRQALAEVSFVCLTFDSEELLAY